MVEEAKDLQIQFESPKVILCSPRVVDKGASKGKGEFFGALTGQIETVLPYRMNSADKNLKIPVEYQMFVEVFEQGRALLGEFSKALERIRVAYKVFDRMSSEDLLSLSKNSNLGFVDFDPGGMCCWTWVVDFCIDCPAMGAHLILSRKFVFDPGIASFGMEIGESKMFVETLKASTALVEAKHCYLDQLTISKVKLSVGVQLNGNAQTVWQSVWRQGFDLNLLQKSQILLPFDRGKVTLLWVSGTISWYSSLIQELVQ